MKIKAGQFCLLFAILVIFLYIFTLIFLLTFQNQFPFLQKENENQTLKWNYNLLFLLPSVPCLFLIFMAFFLT